MKLSVLIAGLAAAFPAFVCASPAMAQIAVSQTPATSPALGVVVRGSAATTFSVSTAGAVTKPSGNAIRMSSAAVTPSTVTITCGLDLVCALSDIRVTVVVAGASGPASISKLRISGLTGATYRTSAPVESSSLTFDLKPIGALTSPSFVLGMDVLLAANAASGNATYTYTVTVTRL